MAISPSTGTYLLAFDNGNIPTPRPIPYKELRSGVIVDDQDLYTIVITTYIPPRQVGDGPWTPWYADYYHSAVYEEAQVAFDIAARREIAQDDFGLEPLGLAMWTISLPEQTGQLDPLSQDETHSLLRTAARILATENILLPPEPLKPWEWPFDERMQPYERQRIIPANRRQGDNVVPYNLQSHRKLGRYVRAIARRLVTGGRIQDVDSWLEKLRWPLWNALKGFRILVPAGRRVNDQTPFGIRIDSFELRPIGDTVFRCSACGYVMGEVLLGVCYRCGQTSEQEPLLLTPQVCNPPALTETKEPAGGVAWPTSSLPQQATEPPILTPQVCNTPALTETKEPAGGVAWLSPSLPQQATEPLLLTPQVWNAPTLTETKELAGGVAWPNSL